MSILRIDYAPGVVKDDTELAARPRAIDTNRVRTIKKRWEKIGGWAKYLTDTFNGIARSILAWLDASNFARIAFGTHTKLYVVESNVFINITPYQESGTLTNPFTTTISSVLVTVSDPGHALTVGQAVFFSGATAVGGLTIDGEYPVTNIIDIDTYQITAASAATSSAGPGGGTVTFGYEINVGLQDATHGSGYGVGAYGTGTYGTTRDSFVLLQPRKWTIDLWGEFLVACPSDGKIYEWQLNRTVRAQLLTDAPVSNRGIFVTAEKHLVAYGADGQKMQLVWCDEDDNTNWTPSDLSTAGERTITGGSEIRFGMRVAKTNLIFADGSVWTMTFVGGEDVFGFDSIATGAAGIVSAYAAIDVNGIAYWMGNGEFYRYDGVLRVIPNSDDIRHFVLDGLTAEQKEKVFCYYQSKFSEIWWFYPADGDLEITRYVKVELKTFTWDVGLITWTTAMDVGVFPSPIAAAPNNLLYELESGHDADGVAMNEYVIFSPLTLGDGRFSMDILQLIPDIKQQEGTIEATMITKEYPNSQEEEVELAKIHVHSEVVDDFRASGRLCKLKFGSSLVGTHWRLGVPVLDLQKTGER